MASPRQIRRRLEEAVEAAISALDAFDGDPDLEPNLGAPDRHPGNGQYNRANPCQTDWAQGRAADLEEECEDEGAQCEDDGFESDSEPDETCGASNLGCHWQDEGDQTTLVPHRMHFKRPASARSQLENVGEFFPVRAL